MITLIDLYVMLRSNMHHFLTDVNSKPVSLMSVLLLLLYGWYGGHFYLTFT
jgi:hypothetical protein